MLHFLNIQCAEIGIEIGLSQFQAFLASLIAKIKILPMISGIRDEETCPRSRGASQ